MCTLFHGIWDNRSSPLIPLIFRKLLNVWPHTHCFHISGTMWRYGRRSIVMADLVCELHMRILKGPDCLVVQCLHVVISRTFWETSISNITPKNVISNSRKRGTNMNLVTGPNQIYENKPSISRHKPKFNFLFSSRT